MSKYRSLQDTDNGQYGGTITIENTHQPRATKKHSSSKDKNQPLHGRKGTRKLSPGEDKAVVIYQKNENLEMNGDSSLFASIVNTESTLTDSPTDGSDKEVSLSESSVGADSEASGSESAPKQTSLLRSSSGYYVHTNGHLRHPSESEPLTKEEGKHMVSYSPQNAFQTLSQSYITTSKECSIQSCLYQFTSMELLMGNNKLLCENCTEKKQKYPKETSSAGKYLA
ncbi:ubiquitin carboxyl-terminal hydrolase 45 [Pontoporia blainvillei]|uniref:Ubiquitin carboxyl-terminal hydrolase 45 n=1 Tax=Pontoporia blainvillei TaxID=48723 RepID=A0ABX0S972_PONBL|nr:ubiquitin carboxyl-terminal hydrolase 45 [Pontoporia blainvillei]